MQAHMQTHALTDKHTYPLFLLSLKKFGNSMSTALMNCTLVSPHKIYLEYY